jgi:hypothetical protein
VRIVSSEPVVYRFFAMDGPQLHERLQALSAPRGRRSLALVLGGHPLRIDGLDDELAGQLERRWGGFVHRADAVHAGTTLRVLRGGPERWLEREALHGGHYRLEAFNEPARRVIASRHFALGLEESRDGWRVALTDEPAAEPLQRVLDNVCRILAAARALARGGFALHAAGVLREQRAFIFAGPSRAGKSTALGLAAPGRSLGDDFGLVLHENGSWTTCASPFDNAEQVVEPPPEGLWPVAGIWRLHQARASRIEHPRGSLAAASLMSCVAFPWLFPDHAQQMLEHVGRLIDSGRFAHLHFTKDVPLWEQLGS